MTSSSYFPNDDREVDAFRECLTNTAAAATEDIDEESSLFKSQNERDACQRLVESLENDLREHAANTSYAYWYLTTQGSGEDERTDNKVIVTEEDKLYAAMREARRHYVYANHDFDKALANLTESCRYRKEKKIDLIRTCFDPQHVYLNPSDETRAKEMADLIRFDMKKQYHILRGQDKFGQSIMIKYPRRQANTTEAAYVMSQIYMAERSTAATEFLTRAKCERSIAVYNYLGFDRSMSPAFPMQIAAATQLQKLYPERLQTLVFVEPPLWLKAVLGVLNPFLSDSITERIQWATGIDERDTTFTRLLGDDLSKATPLLRKDGQLSKPVSLEHFLVDVPFFEIYDNLECQRDITEEEANLDKIAHASPVVDEGPSLAEKATSLWGSI
ncbi:MAG: hypothetical protein SGILL_007890, partial [Bacillariaceae sp.]